MFLFWVILAFIFILNFLFITHEFGHFLMAKKVGAKVLEFGLGFPPRLFKFKKGETIYSFNLIFFGAFVKVLGEEGKSEDPRSYWKLPVFKRFLIASGGVLSNFILAWLILTISIWIYSFLPPKNFVLVSYVKPNSPAFEAGIKTGDLILSINGEMPKSAETVADFTKKNQGEEVNLTLNRFGKKIEKKVKLGFGEIPLGVGMTETAGEAKVPFWKAPFYSAAFLGQAIYISFVYLGKMIIGRAPVEVGGPIAVYGFVRQFASMGYLYLLRLMAVLSLAIGFFNFLPLPALDGGKMTFLILERIFGKKVVRQELENAIHTVGFVILIALSFLIIYKDVMRLIEK